MKKFPNILRKCNKNRILKVGPQCTGSHNQTVPTVSCSVPTVEPVSDIIVDRLWLSSSCLVFLFVFFVLPLLCLQCIPNCAGD